MKMNAVFQCKSPSLGETPCEIRKVITLTDGAYRYFKNHLTEDYAELAGQRLDLVEGYGKTVSDAISEANSQRVKDLYEAAEKEEQALVEDQLFAGQILAGKGDYSVLGKLYGLTQEQIDKLNGKRSGGGSSSGRGSGGGSSSGSGSSSSSGLGSWYDWATSGGPPSLGDFVQMQGKNPSTSKPATSGKPTVSKPSSSKN